MPPSARPRRWAPALLAACLLAPALRAQAPFRRSVSAGYLDFERGVAVASGIAPRRQPGAADRPFQAALTNLEALLYPHPVDAESTLGDLAAYHPDLDAAIDLQLARATVSRREAIPPDLEEVVLELPLRELTLALLPFLGETREGGARPAPEQAAADAPARAVLLLPPSVAREHVPPLLPSLRSLAGTEVFPATSAWLRRAYDRGAVRYMPRGWKPDPADWTLDVVSAGGLAGATLFLRDADAERLRQALGGAEPPEVLVVDARAEGSGKPPAGKAPLPPRERRPGPRPPPTRFRPPEPAAEEPAPAEPQQLAREVAPAGLEDPEPPAERRDLQALLTQLRGRLREGGQQLAQTPADPSPPLAVPVSRDPGLALPARPPPAQPPQARPPQARPPPARPPRTRLAAPLPPARPTPARPAGEAPPAPPSLAPARPPAPARIPLEALAQVPSGGDQDLDRLLYGGGPAAPRVIPGAAEGEPPGPSWERFGGAPAGVEAPPSGSEEGEPPAPPDLVEPPSIRWQYFEEEGEPP